MTDVIREIILTFSKFGSEKHAIRKGIVDASKHAGTAILLQMPASILPLFPAYIY
jgi:hypothetical protein